MQAIACYFFNIKTLLYFAFCPNLSFWLKRPTLRSKGLLKMAGTICPLSTTNPACPRCGRLVGSFAPRARRQCHYSFFVNKTLRGESCGRWPVIRLNYSTVLQKLPTELFTITGTLRSAHDLPCDWSKNLFYYTLLVCRVSIVTFEILL